MPNRYHCRIAIGFILVIAGILAASAKDLDEKTKKFLQKNGPNILRILDEAKEKDYAEIIEEAESRITELREEFLEEEKDGGKDFANKIALLEDNFIALEFELWKIEEGKSSEFRGEQKIERLLVQRVKLQNALDEEVIKKYPTLVSGIRGKGLMLGIESKIKNEILIKEMINHKLLTVKASQNIIRILPPLILEEKHVDEAILKINKAFKNL